MTETVSAKVILAAPIVGSTMHDRVIVELPDGGWQIGKQLRSDRSKFDREFSLSISELLHAAMCGFEGNPAVSQMFGAAPGKGLAAGVLILAMAIGVVPADHAVEGEE